MAAPVLIVPLTWYAAKVAAPEWARFAWLAAVAFSCQVAAGWVWCVAYLAGDAQASSSPGLWTPLLYIALVAASAAAWTGVRRFVRVRDTILDYSMIVVALACVVVAAFDRELAAEWAVIDATLRSLLALFLVVLIGSATLGRWPGGPVPVALVGLTIFGYALCSVSAAIAAGGVSIGTVLPGLLWVVAGLSAMLLPVAALRGIDRPVRILNAAIPGVSPAALTLWWAAAWMIAAGIGLYGALRGDTTVLIIALAAVGWIGLTGIVRTIGALRAIRVHYLELDEALFDLEQADDRAKLLANQ